jgi:phage protein D/phage baseplate assembly protein gpV
MSLISHFYLKLGGEDAPAELMEDLGNIEVDDNLYLPDMFTVQVRDPRFTWADSPLLAVGQEVEILAVGITDSSESQPRPVRLIIGEITAVEPEYPYGSVPLLMLRGYDRAHRLHRGKKTRTFLQVTDSDMVTRIAREYGLRPEIDATTEVHEYIMQNNQTDYEFIMERARRIGFNFLVEDRSLVFKKPANMPSETIELEYGETLRHFRPRMSTASQFKEVLVRGWDAVNKREIIGSAGSSRGPGGGVPGGSSGAGGGPAGGLGSAPGSAGSALGSAAGDAASGLKSELNKLAEQAVGYAADYAAQKTSGALKDARQEALGIVPSELRGAAGALMDRGLQEGMGLLEQHLGSDAAGVVSALASGDSASIAQVGMELGASVVEKAFGEAGSLIVTQHPVSSQSEADELAQAIFEELQAGNVQGEGIATGSPKLTAGCKVRLTALGPKFNGEYFITQTRHTYDAEDGYLTEFSISGRNTNTFADLLFGGSGSNPGLSGNGAPEGVVTGVVTDNRDPQGLGRVKVSFPWLADDGVSNWARVASPMAGAGRGFFVIPEVNDEVLVAFEQGDINRPFILGSLWNGSDTPPIANDEAVDGQGSVVQRIWKTRAGHMILLDDSENNPGIQIVDKNGNKIVIDTSSDKLTIEIGGDVALVAKGKISLAADSDVAVESKASLKIKAASSMEIEASGTVKIKGAMVEIN